MLRNISSLHKCFIICANICYESWWVSCGSSEIILYEKRKIAANKCPPMVKEVVFYMNWRVSKGTLCPLCSTSARVWNLFVPYFSYVKVEPRYTLTAHLEKMFLRFFEIEQRLQYTPMYIRVQSEMYTPPWNCAQWINSCNAHLALILSIILRYTSEYSVSLRLIKETQNGLHFCCNIR